jgi:hypothetical protein
MLNTIKHHTFKIFAGKDNHTLDLGRIMWAVGTVVYFVLSVHSVYKGAIFDPVAWGTGFGAVLAAGGAALWMKKDTEPESVRQSRRLDAQVYDDHHDSDDKDHHDDRDGK